jgi:hypothetical protein
MPTQHDVAASLDEALPLEELDELPLDELDEPPLDELDEPPLEEALPLEELDELPLDEPELDVPPSVTPPESGAAVSASDGTPLESGPTLPSCPGRSEMPRSELHPAATLRQSANTIRTSRALRIRSPRGAEAHPSQRQSKARAARLLRSPNEQVP